jgi:hypothetical protein
MTGCIAPWLVVEYLYIADAVDTEYAYTLLDNVVADYEAIFWLDVISFYVPITYSATIVRSILMENNASLLRAGML